MVSHTPIFDGREEYMRTHWLSYRLDCMILEELGQYLKDCPDFARYDELHRKQWTNACEASYEHGKRLVEEGERLLQSDDVTQDDFLKPGCRVEEYSELYKTLCNKLPARWNGFFRLYDIVMADAGDFEAMYAAFFGVQDADPSPEFLALAEKIMQSSDQIEGSWFPMTQ